MEVIVLLPVVLLGIALLVLVFGWLSSRVAGREEGGEAADAPGDVSSEDPDASPADRTGEPRSDTEAEGAQLDPRTQDRPAGPAAESQNPRPSPSRQDVEGGPEPGTTPSADEEVAPADPERTSERQQRRT